MLVFQFFSSEENWSWKKWFCQILFCASKTRVRMRRATSGAAFKMVCSRPADGSWARLGVNQGEAEGVDFRPRLKLSPQICPQDCPRGTAAGRFLWESCELFSDFMHSYPIKSVLSHFLWEIWTAAVPQVVFLWDNCGFHGISVKFSQIICLAPLTNCMWTALLL